MLGKYGSNYVDFSFYSNEKSNYVLPTERKEYDFKFNNEINSKQSFMHISNEKNYLEEYFN